jgi:hypothetical protein
LKTAKETLFMASRAILLGLSILLSCSICLSTSNDQPFDSEEVGRVDPSKTTVLVAKRNLASGTVFTKPGKYFEKKEIPARAAPRNAVSSLESLYHQKLNKPFSEDSIITEDDLCYPRYSWFDHLKSQLERTPAGYIPFPIFDYRGGNWQQNVRIHLVQICEDDNGEEFSRVVFCNVLTVWICDFEWRGSTRLVYFVAIRPSQVLAGILASFRGHFSLEMPKYGLGNEGA